MNFNLLPYIEIDGIRTVRDSDIKALFERTMADGLDKIVFYEGTIQTADQFLAAMKYGDVLFYLIHVDGVTIGYTWLNRFENHTARHHFCTFKEYWGDSVSIGKKTLFTIMGMMDQYENYVFDLLTGFVPVWNARAIQFAQKCGGKSLGVVPNAVWNNDKNKSEDAVFIYYTRGDV